MPHIRVLSWNLNARRDCARQVAALAELAPDVVALQEVTDTGTERFREILHAGGLPHFLSGAALARAAGREQIAKRFVALATRWPLEAQPATALPRPELVVNATLCVPGLEIVVAAVHIPTWSNGREAKVLTQEGVCSLMGECTGPAVLLGDFNSPKAELEDGTVEAFIRPRDVRGRAAEMALMAPSTAAGRMADAFRAVNGYAVNAESWFWKNRGRTGGYRLDHIFVSCELRAVRCWYAHELRERGLSDHSPIIADLTW